MLIKLVQGKTLNVAALPVQLDYSLLNGDSDWEVWVNFSGGPYRKIAHVTWGYASSYTLNLAGNRRGPYSTLAIPFRQDIVPAVKAQIARACRAGTMRDPKGPPLIRVFPNAAT